MIADEADSRSVSLRNGRRECTKYKIPRTRKGKDAANEEKNENNNWEVEEEERRRKEETGQREGEGAVENQE